MTKNFLSVRPLAFLVLGAVVVGLSGMALIGVMNPGVYRGMVRFGVVLVVSSTVVTTLIWAGAASARALQLRLRQPN